ncbi:MAG: acyl-CoA dehydratase activase-related protein, partial [Desulfobacteraceae bacterium]|nr:acyl-CoA dehydratase activase-related protein [Desulfobacteraceae bacterium]
MDMLFAGFDIGTDCVSAVVLDNNFKIVFSPEPLFHFGNPVHVLKDLTQGIIQRFGKDALAVTAFTGTGGERFASLLDVPFYHDTITIPAGVALVSPETKYVFHIGAKDSYFFELEKINSDSPLIYVPDHGTGTKCGGGSGILITKQCRRFFENDFVIDLSHTDARTKRARLNQRLKDIFQKADEEIAFSDKRIDVGGRCGVVIQSDMIHLQNSGEKIRDILRGLYVRIIKNYISDVLKSRTFQPDSIAYATGGVFESPHLLSLLNENTGLSVSVHDRFRSVGALGAVVKAKNERRVFSCEDLDNLVDSERKSVKMVPGLKTALSRVIIYDEEQPTNEGPLQIFQMEAHGKHPVILGIDGGSTTTKAVILHQDTLKILAQICLYTNGKPLETIKDIFRQIRESLGSCVDINAVAYTGSSGAFYHKLFTRSPNGSGAKTIDLVKDEITCHALGVKHFNDKTDTIFELGGQDAKFTLFNPDGTVKKSRMNLSCMAGTGQTMQNMVEMIGLDIRSTFHDYALSAEQTPVVDDTCGVFTEAGIARLISLGFPKNEIAAAIAYGFMGGYVNKFIGNEAFGACASAQGGPFIGKAPLAALAMHTNMDIHAFPHRQLFGALGAALAVHQEIRRLESQGKAYECRFRGLGVADQTFEKKDTLCDDEIKDSCGIKQCRLSIYRAGLERIITGGACPKGNTDSSIKKMPDYIELYKKILEKHLKNHISEYQDDADERILIPRSLTFLNEKGVFYAALYRNLGFQVLISPETSDEISEMGLACSHSEACYPVKLAHGHTAFLKNILRPGKDKILLVNAIGSSREKHKFCPYVSGAGFLAKDALDMDNSDVLLPVIYFNDPDNPLCKSFYNDL